MIHLLFVLKALADETRFKIINLLLTRTLCVEALANRLGISEAAVSQHLKILRKAGLVKGEKRGYWTHYLPERERLLAVAANLNDMVLKPFAIQELELHDNQPKHHCSDKFLSEKESK